MAKLKFVVVDRTKASFLKDAQDYYLKRLSKYTSTKWIEVRSVPIRGRTGLNRILESEAETIKRQLNSRDFIVALDRRGSTFDSKGLARHLDLLLQKHGTLAFIIGGPLGLHKSILDESNEKLSLSQLTFTHEMTRIILLEQIYRSFTILRGEQYHK